MLTPRWCLPCNRWSTIGWSRRQTRTASSFSIPARMDVMALCTAINEFGPSRVAGRFGRAIFFRGPGVGDYVLVPNYPKATNDQLTVSAWVTGP